MRCPNCDRENRDVARFCQYCGASLAAAETPDPLHQETHPSESEQLSELPPEQIPASPTLAAQDALALVEQPETALAPGPEDQVPDQELPDRRPPAKEIETPVVEALIKAEATETVAEVFPPDEDGVDSSSQTAEKEMPVLFETDSSGSPTLSGDLGKDDHALEEWFEKPSPDVEAVKEGAALAPASGDGTGDQEPDQDEQKAQADTEGWKDEEEQEPESAPLELAELELIPSEEAVVDTVPELEETTDPDEPLIQVEELAAAGLLPWNDRPEPEQVPLTALEPGSVVNGRYQVIEVVQIGDQEARYRVRDLARCPRCGSTDNSPDEAFCVSCGALMEQKPIANLLERAALGEDEPAEAQDGEYLEHNDRHYWVWQEMNQEPAQDVQPTMRLILGQMSDTGQVRELDEDSLFVLTMSSTYESVTHQLGLFVVADGMGGHEGGEVASRIALQNLAQSLLGNVFAPELAGNPLTENAILEHLERAVQAANDQVYLERQKRDNDMGTTVTVALVIDWALYLAHVGDCRAYRWGQDGLQQLTTDHSIVAGMVAAGTIEPEEIYTHPQRSVIYRSIGDRPAVEVDLSTLSLYPDDRLVLCCDGLWEMIRNEGIEDVLLRESDPQTACEIMVEQANRAGGSDNISVIIVQL